MSPPCPFEHQVMALTLKVAIMSSAYALHTLRMRQQEQQQQEQEQAVRGAPPPPPQRQQRRVGGSSAAGPSAGGSGRLPIGRPSCLAANNIVSLGPGAGLAGPMLSYLRRGPSAGPAALAGDADFALAEEEAASGRPQRSTVLCLMHMQYVRLLSQALVGGSGAGVGSGGR